MIQTKRVLAFDFGASSGRAMIGEYDGNTITLKEIHRFSNDPVVVGDTMYWDTLRLFYEIKQGMMKAKHAGGFQSIAVDTWGVDFGLLDEDGRLLENPVHYRDARTTGMLKEAFELLDETAFYEITGNQFMEINTAFQLLSLAKKRPKLLERAKTMLMTPDLFHYLLSGVKKTEYSIASTSQLLDAKKRVWSDQVLEALQLPKEIFTEIVPSGTKIGQLSKEICEELGLEPVDIIAVAGHDTQSALAAVPTEEKDFIFLSCGTWSLLGTELEEPIINQKSAEFNITNEGGYANKATFLKNIIGLWLIQESRRQWIREGEEYGFGLLEEMAKEVKPFQCFIDPDSPEFIPAGNVPRRIREYCKKTGQEVPMSSAEITRCINESLAMKYRYSLEQIAECTGKEYQSIHIVGGGVQSTLLCQMTANSCNCKVVGGPVEATVFGNIALQLVASGDIKDLSQVRKVISASSELYTYEPMDSDLWNVAYQRFRQVTSL